MEIDKDKIIDDLEHVSSQVYKDMASSMASSGVPFKKIPPGWGRMFCLIDQICQLSKENK